MNEAKSREVNVVFGATGGIGTAVFHMLSLSHTQVGDAGLKHLGEVPLVLSLDLSNTQITGPGLNNSGTCTSTARGSPTKV